MDAGAGGMGCSKNKHFWRRCTNCVNLVVETHMTLWANSWERKLRAVTRSQRSDKFASKKK